MNKSLGDIRYYGTVDFGYCISEGTREICMLYPKIRYKRGKLVVNVPSGTYCLVRYMRQKAISEGVIAEVHCMVKIHAWTIIFVFLFPCLFLFIWPTGPKCTGDKKGEIGDTTMAKY